MLRKYRPHFSIGFTHTDDAFHTIAGDQGMILMHALCQDDFGLDSRMCTSEEFWLSPNAEALTADAWLHPTLEGGGKIDFSGIDHPASLSCNGWTSIEATNFGLVVTTAGKTRNALGCDNARSRPVTCCEPIQ